MSMGSIDAVTMAPRTLNAADAQGRELNQNQHIYDQNGIQFQQEVRREGRQTVETQESETKDYDKKGNGEGTGAKNSSKKKQKQEKKERLAPRSTGSFDITNLRRRMDYDSDRNHIDYYWLSLPVCKLLCGKKE